jgi:hypothetical protein
VRAAATFPQRRWRATLVADNDNEEWLSSFKAAKILGVTPPTLRNWLYYGRPVVGLRRKKRKELNAEMIGGHLKFEAASVHALAKKISRLGWRARNAVPSISQFYDDE